MAVLSMETTIREYELLRTELRSISWRTIAVLLGSTFLVNSWFSVVGARVSLTAAIRLFIAMPYLLVACAWVMWMGSEVFSYFTSYPRDVLRERDYDSEYDSHWLLDRIQMLRYRVNRLHRYQRMINLIIAAEFIVIGIATWVLIFVPRW